MMERVDGSHGRQRVVYCDEVYIDLIPFHNHILLELLIPVRWQHYYPVPDALLLYLYLLFTLLYHIIIQTKLTLAPKTNQHNRVRLLLLII